MTHDLTKAHNIQRDFLFLRLRAVAEDGPHVFLVEVAYVHLTELSLKLAPRRDPVGAVTPSAPCFAF